MPVYSLRPVIQFDVVFHYKCNNIGLCCLVCFVLINTNIWHPLLPELSPKLEDHSLSAVHDYLFIYSRV